MAWPTCGNTRGLGAALGSSASLTDIWVAWGDAGLLSFPDQMCIRTLNAEEGWPRAAGSLKAWR